MSNRVRALLPILLTACVVWCSPPSVLAQSKPATVTVTVKTVDVAGKPISDVTLRGFRMDKAGPVTPFEPDLEATTDGKGVWQAEVPVGEFMILAQKSNLVAPSQNGQTWWQLNKKTSKPVFTIKLIEGGEVDVTVLDAATRQPLPQAKVVFDCGHALLTDAQGRAHFTGVPRGERCLQVISPPLADANVDINTTEQPSAKVEALLAPGFQVRGQVRDSTGKPVPGAVVEDNYSGSTFLVQMNVCVTEGDGRYQLGWYPKGKPLWNFTVTHRDYADQSKSGLPAPVTGDTAQWDFVVDAGSEIAGSVTDKAGQPIKGASVRYGITWSLIGRRWARTDEQGKFLITKIGESERRVVVAEAEGYAPAWHNATPGRAGREVPHLEFKLDSGLKVKGSVVDREGKPVTGVTIAPQAKIEGRTVYAGSSVGVDSKGHFELTSLPATGTSLDLYGRNVSAVRRLPFDPAKPLVVTVDKPGVIMGKVIDAQSRQPVQKFNVRLNFPKAPKAPGEPDASYSAHLSMRGQDTQAEDGHFLIDDLIARAGHAVHIQAEGYVLHHTDKVRARAADDPAWPQEFALDPGLAVRGQLQDAVSGNPISGAKVFYAAKEKWYAKLRSTSVLSDIRDYNDYNDVAIVLSDAAGWVDLHLPRDEKLYSVIVSAPGYAPLFLPSQPAAQSEQTFPTLEPEAKVIGTVAGLPGFDPAKDKINVFTPAGTFAEFLSVNPDGTFGVSGLPAGKAVISAYLHDSSRTHGSAVVELVSGQTTSVDLASQCPCSVIVMATLDGKPLDDGQVFVKTRGWGDDAASECLVGSGQIAEDDKLTLTHLPPVRATVECIEESTHQLLSRPIDLSAPSLPPIVRFEFKTPKAGAK